MAERDPNIIALQKCKLIKKGITIPSTIKGPLFKFVEKVQMAIATRPTDEPFTFKLDDFDFGGKLGSGKFGNVFLVREKYTEFILAMKVIDKEFILKENLQNELCKEIGIHSKLQHSNIIKFYTYFKDTVNVYLLMEYVTGGTLFTTLKNQPDGKLDSFCASRYTYQMGDALSYLHSLSIVHRDVKPENILLDLNGNAKLCDFGWAAKCSCYLKKFCGTSSYLAPEIIEKKNYNAGVDIWSLGILIYELLCGKPPFNGKNSKILFSNIKKAHINYPKHLDDSVIDLISAVLKYNSNERLPLKKIMSHQWVNNYYLSL